MKALKLIELIRPKQWIKNLFCFAPILFAGKMTDLSMLYTNLLAFITFCGISSCVYIINDISDIDSDRVHKKKRFRPLASGDISINEAKILFIVIFIPTLLLTLTFNFNFAIVILVYFIINLFYSLKVKDIVLLDVFFISFGFMLRVIGGATAIEVSISNWMILTTIFLSLFLGISKRRAELSQANSEDIEKQRRVLSKYSIAFTDQLNTIAATGTIISYALYTVSDKALEAFKTPNLIYTTPFVIYGMFRYLYLIHQKNLGDSPTSIVTKDLPIIINSFLWLLISFAIIYKSKFGLGISF